MTFLVIAALKRWVLNSNLMSDDHGCDNGEIILTSLSCFFLELFAENEAPVDPCHGSQGGSEK